MKRKNDITMYYYIISLFYVIKNIYMYHNNNIGI